MTVTPELKQGIEAGAAGLTPTRGVTVEDLLESVLKNSPGGAGGRLFNKR